MKFKLGFISDTHNRHSELSIPDDLDFIFHCGDICKRGSLTELEDFASWFHSIEVKHKILIAGNHDLCLENKKKSEKALQIVQGKSFHYLNDSSTEIDGIKIHGSPIQPSFNNWAFNRARGEVIQKHWDLIPHDTDILLTHGGPYQILDLVYNGIEFGCEDLRDKVMQIRPKFHAFGHIHEARGVEEINGIKFINCSSLDRHYKEVQPVMVFDYET